MGLFYEVAKGVLKKPRSVSKRVLSEGPVGLSEGMNPMRKKRFASQMPWEDYTSTSEGAGRTVEKEGSRVVRKGTVKSDYRGYEPEEGSYRSGDYTYPDVETDGILPDKFGDWKRPGYRKEEEIPIVRGHGLEETVTIARQKQKQGRARDLSYARAEAARKSRDELYPTSEILDYRSGLSSSSSSGRTTWEEPPVFKEKVALSDSQWQRYLQRISDRTPTGQTRSTTGPAAGGAPRPDLFRRTDNPIAQGDAAATEAMNTMQPQVAPTPYGRLTEGAIKTGPDRTPGKVYDAPVGESIDKYIDSHADLGGPGDLKPYSRTDLPNARTLSVDKAGEATYQERRYDPKFGDKVDNAVGVFKKAGPALTRAAERQKATGQEVTPIKDVIKKLMMLDDLWTQVGGRRSLTGKKWDTFRKSAPGRYKVDDVKDFFLGVGIKWLEGPSSVDKRHAKLLDEMWTKYQQSK